MLRSWLSRGWLVRGHAGELLARVAACAQPVLVLVDEADTHQDLVALLERLAQEYQQVHVRVLLLARDARGLQQRS